MPEYDGPWGDGFPDLWSSSNPMDDGKFSPLSEVEEYIEYYSKVGV
jgi:hypothetical protein